MTERAPSNDDLLDGEISADEFTQLYRHFNAAGDLLYVGISLSAVHRLSQHRDSSPWFSEIARVEVQAYLTRDAALEAERAAIMSERPKHNKVHARKNNDPARPGAAAEARKDLVHHVVSVRPAYKEVDLPRILCLPAKNIRRLMDEGKLGYFEDWNSTMTKTHRYVTGWQLIDFLDYAQRKGDLTKDVAALSVDAVNDRLSGSLLR